MKKLQWLVVALFALSAVASAQQTDAGKLSVITVSGTAEINVVPDMASFRLRITKTDKSLISAKAQNDGAIARLLDLTRNYSINATDVKTDFISVKEKYNRFKQKGDEEYTSVFAGYTVSRTVIVRLRDLERFEALLSDVVTIGVTEVSDVTFESSQLRKYKDQARAMAIRAAQEKAQAIAKEIGQTIGRALSIQEANVDEFRSPFANRSSNSFSTDGEDADEDTAIGTISVKAQIKVDFLLN